CVALQTWGCKEAIELIDKGIPGRYHDVSTHAGPQSFEQGGQRDEDEMELDDEAEVSPGNSLYDTADGLIKLWQGTDLRQGPGGQCRNFTCPPEVHERVSNWLMAQ
ncbi:1529_t:CDS:1, partial [Acaulospora colombiana]